MSRDQPTYLRYTVCATSLHFTMNEHIRGLYWIFDVQSHLSLNRENKGMHLSDRRGGNPHHLRDQLWPVQINISMKATRFITQFASSNQLYFSSFSSSYASSTPKRQSHAPIDASGELQHQLRRSWQRTCINTRTDWHRSLTSRSPPKPHQL